MQPERQGIYGVHNDWSSSLLSKLLHEPDAFLRSLDNFAALEPELKVPSLLALRLVPPSIRFSDKGRDAFAKVIAASQFEDDDFTRALGLGLSGDMRCIRPNFPLLDLTLDELEAKIRAKQAISAENQFDVVPLEDAYLDPRVREARGSSAEGPIRSSQMHLQARATPILPSDSSEDPSFQRILGQAIATAHAHAPASTAAPAADPRRTNAVDLGSGPGPSSTLAARSLFGPAATADVVTARGNAASAAAAVGRPAALWNRVTAAAEAGPPPVGLDLGGGGGGGESEGQSLGTRAAATAATAPAAEFLIPPRKKQRSSKVVGLEEIVEAKREQERQRVHAKGEAAAARRKKGGSGGPPGGGGGLK